MIFIFLKLFQSLKQQKVAVNIARQASYDYILSRQKSIKNAKKGSISMSFWKPEPCGQKVLLDRSLSIRQKLVKIPKI